jgi:hypothetical protein
MKVLLFALLFFVVMGFVFNFAWQQQELMINPPAENSGFRAFGGGGGGGIPASESTIFAPPWGWLAWLEGLWQQAIKDGWDSSTGNPPSGCCGGGGGGGFGGDGPTTYPNNARRR